MSLGSTTLKFVNRSDAEQWIDQVKAMWVVTRSEIVSRLLWVHATIECPTKDGHLIPANPTTEEETRDGKDAETPA